MDLDKTKKVIAGYYGIPVYKLHARTRKRVYTNARQVAITIIRCYANCDDNKIKAAFNREHSTIVSTFRQKLEEIVLYRSVREEILDVCCMLGLQADFIIGFAQYYYERQDTVKDIPKYMLKLLAEYNKGYQQLHSFNTQQ